MTSKLNIFNSLPQHASDSEDEVTVKNAKNKTTHEKREQRKTDGAKGPHGHTAPRDPNQKEDVTRSKNQQKQKGVTAEAHPNDRQSGTGVQAYGGKPKKAGAGKGNWGNFKEDRKVNEEGEEVESPEVQEEEEKPEGKTLAEYLASRGQTQSQAQVNEAKSKITSEQLMKEVGKATLLKNRVQQEIDDKKAGTKKGRLDVDHHASINTEHSELLGFRTGFVEREYRERTRDGDAPQQPRKFGGRREDRQKEETTTEAVAETTPVEGTTTEGAATTTEAKPEEGQKTEKRQPQRGGRGGYTKGGDRPQGERRPYQGKQGGNNTKVNVEDESAFPKLG
jgi:hypothetical protein